MAEILVVTWDGAGNVPPAVGIARELQRRGHAVRFAGHARQHEPLTAAGFEVAPSREARPFFPLDDNSPLSYIKTFGDRGLGRDVTSALAGRPRRMSCSSTSTTPSSAGRGCAGRWGWGCG
jgi:hypothetical protein